jgi:hypothetical protein
MMTLARKIVSVPGKLTKTVMEGLSDGICFDSLKKIYYGIFSAFPR